MTKLILALAIATVTTFSLAATKSKYKLGKVSEDELLSDQCPLDDEAGAYYIFDIGKSSIEFDNSTTGKWVLKFERKFKIKVLNKEGVSAANFIIPLHDYGPHRKDHLTFIKGRTYNLVSGKIVDEKLRSDNIHELSANKYLKHVKFAMPQVRAGSIIEVEYTITSDLLSYYYPWDFQHDIPVIHSEYDVTIPDFLEYSVLTAGHTYFKKQDLGNFNESFTIKYVDHTGPGLPTQQSFTLDSYSQRLLFSADSIEAFYPESFISSPRDNMTRISFQLTSVKYKNSANHNISETWEMIDTRLLNDEEFGGFLKKEKSFYEILSNLYLTSANPEEQIADIYYQLKSHLQWNEYYSLYTNHSALQVWESGSANSAELNLILCGVLNAAGIDAQPLVSSTRNWGYFNRYTPSIAQLNHVMTIAAIGERKVLLDLTGNAPPGLIPANSINLFGRIPGGEAELAWVPLTPSQGYKTHTLINITLDPANNQVEGIYQSVSKDYAALYTRNLFSGQTYEAELQDLFNNQYPGLRIKEMQVEGFEHLSDDIKTKFNFSYNNSIEKAGDNYLVSIKLANQFGENPFAGGDRKYPIDLAYSREVKSNMTINIPEGYQIENLPEAQKIALPENKGSFQFMVLQQGNIVQINSSFLLNEKIFTSNEFDYLKQFYGLVLTKLNEPIVLSKI